MKGICNKRNMQQRNMQQNRGNVLIEPCQNYHYNKQILYCILYSRNILMPNVPTYQSKQYSQSAYLLDNYHQNRVIFGNDSNQRGNSLDIVRINNQIPNDRSSNPSIQNTNNKENIQSVNQQDLTIEQKRKQNQKENGFQFISKQHVSSFLICKICHQLMIFPMRLFPCGHTYCKKCLKYERRCPIPPPQCGKFYMALQPDIVATNLIDDLQVKCLSKDCPWYGTLDQFKKKHSKQCQLKNGGLQQWLKGIRNEVSKFDKQKQQRKKISQNLQYEPLERFDKQKQKVNINIAQQQDVEVISSSHPNSFSSRPLSIKSNRKAVNAQVIDIQDPNLKRNANLNSQTFQITQRHQQFVGNNNRQRGHNPNNQQHPNITNNQTAPHQQIVLDLDEDIQAQFFNNYEGLPQGSRKMVNNWKKKIDKSVKEHLPVLQIPKHKKGDQMHINNPDPQSMTADKKLIKQTKKSQKDGGFYGNLFRQ